MRSGLLGSERRHTGRHGLCRPSSKCCITALAVTAIGGLLLTTDGVSRHPQLLFQIPNLPFANGEYGLVAAVNDTELHVTELEDQWQRSLNQVLQNQERQQHMLEEMQRMIAQTHNDTQALRGEFPRLGRPQQNPSWERPGDVSLAGAPIQITDDGACTAGSAARSLLQWVKLNPGQQGGYMLGTGIELSDCSNSGSHMDFKVMPGYMGVWGSCCDHSCSHVAGADGQWHFYAFTYDEHQQLRFYVDGVLACGSYHQTCVNTNCNHKAQIGAGADGSYVFDGQVNDLRYFDGLALTPAQIHTWM